MAALTSTHNATTRKAVRATAVAGDGVWDVIAVADTTYSPCRYFTPEPPKASPVDGRKSERRQRIERRRQKRNP